MNEKKNDNMGYWVDIIKQQQQHERISISL